VQFRAQKGSLPDGNWASQRGDAQRTVAPMFVGLHFGECQSPAGRNGVKAWSETSGRRSLSCGPIGQMPA
jgi:hypothetical protein